MKKILYTLFVVFSLASCGGNDDSNPIDPTPTFDNWNDPANPNYTDGKYNTLKGEWQLIQRNGANVTEFLVYKFADNFTLSEATTEPAEEKDPTYTNSKSYITNDKEYKIGNTVYKYAIAGTLESARLTIQEGNTTLTFKPYESKVWSWKGDWNSPSDPHYSIYNGKYNPIKGTWKLTHENGLPTTEITYYSFNDNFEWKQGYYSSILIGKYIINDTGIRNTKNNAPYKYTIKENILTLIGMDNAKGIHLILTKYD